MRLRRQCYCIPACVLGIVVLSIQSVSAARLLDVYIERDGQVIVHTFYDDGGRADAATVWRYLADPPIMVDDKTTRLEADAGSSLDVAIEGDILIRIQHVDRVIAQAKLSTLMLHRAAEQTDAWFLPEAEVERAARVAGLGPPSAPPSRTMPVRLSSVLAISILVLVGLLGTIVFIRRHRPKAMFSE